VTEYSSIDIGKSAIQSRIAALVEEHRDMDMAIAALQKGGGFDMMQVQRLKKRKLLLKDQIGALENMLIPDIIA